MEGDGGIVENDEDPDGTVSTIFISTHKMKSAFVKSTPTVIQVDISFGFDTARYKVLAFCYVNPRTNKSEQSLVKCFKRICTRDDYIFMANKDFTDIDGLKEVFHQNLAILLCIFHVLKYVNSLFATAPVKVEKKNALMLAFKNVLYAHNETRHFTSYKRTYLKKCPVLKSDAKTGINNYYVRNWQSCSDMWMIVFRKSLPRLGDDTNNQIERMIYTVQGTLIDFRIHPLRKQPLYI